MGEGVGAEVRMTRRGLATGIAAVGAVAGLSPMLGAEPGAVNTGLQSSEWTQVYPGVWRARLGTPEKFTPVTSRLVPPKTEAFQKLPGVDEAPLPAIHGKSMNRGFLVEFTKPIGDHFEAGS